MLSAQIIITGFVQGVGFRQFVKRQAEQLHLTGWVRNVPDGSVEAVVQGTKEDIDKFIENCQKGPFLSEVENIEVKRDGGKEKFDAFEIIHL